MAGKFELIEPEIAHQHVAEDHEAVLVCAYDSEEKFKQNHLEGAISLDELKKKENSIPKEKELIFYCA